ncbi:MBL fold metallo-hydrolase [Nocardia beijingensis]
MLTALIDGQGVIDVGGAEVELSIGSFLVDVENGKVLVDLGVGPVVSGSFHGGRLLEELSAQGVSPEDIDHVLLTHLHWDHIGWAATDGKPTFPKAVYWCGRRDWEYFVDQDRSPQSKLKPVRDSFRFSEELAVPGFSAMPAPGHTPGSYVYTTVDQRGREIWFVGDIIHYVDELTRIDLPAIGDLDPETALATRISILRAAAEREAISVPAHLESLAGIRLRSIDFPFDFSLEPWR